MPSRVTFCTKAFQLTRPVRGEPISVRRRFSANKFQLTRPVRGEPTMLTKRQAEILNFNSLAPCGANPDVAQRFDVGDPFQLTRPVRGEPASNNPFLDIAQISTHSPRAGRTECGHQNRLIDTDFNSLAPCGANLEVR